jgi:hypothetical protein
MTLDVYGDVKQASETRWWTSWCHI